MNFWKILISMVIFGNAPFLNAQPFQQAPDISRKVKCVTEWVRTDAKATAKKAGESWFTKKGQLYKYIPGANDFHYQHFYYDARGRISRQVEGNDTDSIVTKYAYNSSTTIKEKFFRGKHYRSVYFYKDNKKVEEKTFARGVELGSQYKLKTRVVYSYYPTDSLRGEMHYEYPFNDREKPQTRKVVHEYDDPGGKRSRSLEYDYDGALRIETLYGYDKAGRLAKVLHRYAKDDSQRLIEYLYKDGKQWQIIDDYQYKKVVSIFVDGRLIRNRSYVGDQLFAIVDYQYAYYE